MDTNYVSIIKYVSKFLHIVSVYDEYMFFRDDIDKSSFKKEQRISITIRKTDKTVAPSEN